MADFSTELSPLSFSAKFFLGLVLHFVEVGHLVNFVKFVCFGHFVNFVAELVEENKD